MKKSSHLIEETQIDVGDNRTVLYGTHRGVIRITVRGMFTPFEKKKSTYYMQAASALSDSLSKAIRKKLETLEQIYHYTIVETDITVRGLKFGVPAKMRYTFFVHQVDADADRVELVKHILAELSPIVDKTLEGNGFKRVDVPEPDMHRHTSKKI